MASSSQSFGMKKLDGANLVAPHLAEQRVVQMRLHLARSLMRRCPQNYTPNEFLHALRKQVEDRRGHKHQNMQLATVETSSFDIDSQYALYQQFQSTQSMLQELQTQEQSLQLELQSSQSALQASRNQETELRTRVESTQAALLEAEKEKKNIVSEYKLTCRTLEESQSKEASLRADIQSLTQSMEEWKAKAYASQDAALGNANERAAYELRIETLTRQVDTSTKKANVCLLKYNRAASSLVEQQQEYTDLKAKFDKLSRESEDISVQKNRMVEIENELKESTSTVHELQSRVEELKEELKSTSAELCSAKSIEAKFDSLQERVMELENEKKMLETEAELCRDADSLWLLVVYRRAREITAKDTIELSRCAKFLAALISASTGEEHDVTTRELSLFQQALERSIRSVVAEIDKAVQHDGVVDLVIKCLTQLSHLPHLTHLSHIFTTFLTALHDLPLPGLSVTLTRVAFHTPAPLRKNLFLQITKVFSQLQNVNDPNFMERFDIVHKLMKQRYQTPSKIPLIEPVTNSAVYLPSPYLNTRSRAQLVLQPKIHGTETTASHSPLYGDRVVDVRKSTTATTASQGPIGTAAPSGETDLPSFLDSLMSPADTPGRASCKSRDRSSEDSPFAIVLKQRSTVDLSNAATVPAPCLESSPGSDYYYSQPESSVSRTKRQRRKRQIEPCPTPAYCTRSATKRKVEDILPGKGPAKREKGNEQGSSEFPAAERVSVQLRTCAPDLAPAVKPVTATSSLLPNNIGLEKQTLNISRQLSQNKESETTTSKTFPPKISAAVPSKTATPLSPDELSFLMGNDDENNIENYSSPSAEDNNEDFMDAWSLSTAPAPVHDGYDEYEFVCADTSSHGSDTE